MSSQQISLERWLPVVLTIITLGGFILTAGGYLEKLDRLIKDVQAFNDDNKEQSRMLYDHERRLSIVEKIIENIPIKP